MEYIFDIFLAVVNIYLQVNNGGNGVDEDNHKYCTRIC